jgi:universal stress protein A
MLPFKKILCPTDFSEFSQAAIREATELGSQFGSELLLLHVVTPVVVPAAGVEPVPPNLPVNEQELEEDAKTFLRNWVDRLQSQGLKVRSILRRGNAADEIIRAAEEEDADLLVIATRGKTGLTRILLGSVAERVVRHAPCRVLTISPKIVEETGPETAWQSPEGEKASAEIPEERKVFQEKIEAQWKEAREKMEELKARGEKIRTEWMDVERRMEKLRTQQEAVRRKIHELKNSGQEAWKDLRDDARKRLEELRKTMDQTMEEFRLRKSKAREEISKKREKYVAKVEAQLKDWGAKIDKLKDKAEKSGETVKAKYDQQIEELRKKQEAVRGRMRDYRTTGGEAFGDLKGGLDQALEELKKSFKQAVFRFKETKKP